MENKFFDFMLRIENMMGAHTEILNSQSRELVEIKEQTKKTNGRVTELERTQALLARVESQNSGMIRVVQDELQKQKDRGDLDGRTIDEIKKKVDSGFDSKEKSAERRFTLLEKLITIFGTALAGLIVWYFQQ